MPWVKKQKKNNMKKVLFIASHRKNRAPGQRFRFEQFFNYLEKNEFQCDLSYIVTEKYDKTLYKKGKYFQKLAFIIYSHKIRKKNLRNINNYDIIFLFREALMTRSIKFERLFKKKSNAKIIFDFDDAIWLQNVSQANKKFSWMKNPAKTSMLVKLSDLVFAGNEYLANYARQFNKNVVIIPTSIDTDEYKPTNKKNNKSKIVIGWSGSVTTIEHFKYAIPFLKEIKYKYKDKVEIKVIGDGNYINTELEVKGKPWVKSTELDDLCSFDIGIMPLPNDEWSKGKCGLKGLQYMALEIPTIMSPVGVNTEIIEDESNGFLASKEEEWVEKLSMLIESKELREKIGKAGRQTVIDKYSFHAQKDRYVRCFNELLRND